MVNKGVSEAEEAELEGVEAAISSSEGTFKSTLRPATGEQTLQGIFAPVLTISIHSQQTEINRKQE